MLTQSVRNALGAAILALMVAAVASAVVRGTHKTHRATVAQGGTSTTSTSGGLSSGGTTGGTTETTAPAGAPTTAPTETTAAAPTSTPATTPPASSPPTTAAASGLGSQGSGQVETAGTTARTGGLPFLIPGIAALVLAAGLRRLARASD